MTDKEAMKLALFALDIVKIHYTQSRHINEAIAALKERLAQPEPIQSLQCFHCQVTIETLNDKVMQLMAQRTEQEPDWKDGVMEQQEETILWQAKRIAKLIDTLPQRTEQEPVAWPCLINSADFSANTITLVMQCEDYKVSAGTHWLSTTPPKETT